MPAPIRFTPLFMPRVWGGRRLEDLYGKPLPPGLPIGEAWELVDRDRAQSVVAGGPHGGRTLHDLWTEHRRTVFGTRADGLADRFPILIKLLDARETLSVQVHPPAPLAAELGGEPKNELWYLTAVTPGAHLYAGLRSGVTREAFAAALVAGEDVSWMLHRFEVAVGDAMFIPAGRVHTIGGGCVIMEVQQNSDTTYRVFDFHRPGLDGRPRELHIAQSMACIDWTDIEPPLADVGGDGDGPIAANEFFVVTRYTLNGPSLLTAPGECAIVTVIDGAVACGGRRFAPGEIFLIPADGAEQLTVGPVAGLPATVLVTELPG